MVDFNKILMRTLWLLSGCLILPCVLIAGAFDPWIKWGEEL